MAETAYRVANCEHQEFQSNHKEAHVKRLFPAQNIIHVPLNGAKDEKFMVL